MIETMANGPTLRCRDVQNRIYVMLGKNEEYNPKIGFNVITTLYARPIKYQNLLLTDSITKQQQKTAYGFLISKKRK